MRSLPDCAIFFLTLHLLSERKICAMKNKLYASAFIALSLLTLTGCEKKKPTNIIITKKPQVVKPSKPKPMGDYSQKRKMEWVGNEYTVVSTVKADPSLPLAADGTTRYFDNRITVEVLRRDSTSFFKRTFQKEDFHQYVDDIYYKHGALLGIVFVKAEGNTLLFAASVGNPDKSSDEYVPLVLKIDNFGNVTISKDTQLDTGATEEEEAEDEGI